MYLPLSPMYAIDVVNTQQNKNKKEKTISQVLINLSIVILDNLKIIIAKPIRSVKIGDSKCKDMTVSNGIKYNPATKFLRVSAFKILNPKVSPEIIN